MLDMIEHFVRPVLSQLVSVSLPLHVNNNSEGEVLEKSMKRKGVASPVTTLFCRENGTSFLEEIIYLTSHFELEGSSSPVTTSSQPGLSFKHRTLASAKCLIT